MFRFHIKAVLLVIFISAIATPQTKPDHKMLHAVMECRTVSCVNEKRKDLDTTVEMMVFYIKWLLLDESSQTASIGLLENMPWGPDDLAQLMAMREQHDSAPGRNMAVIYENWPRLISVAVQRFPTFLPTYIRYGKRFTDSQMAAEYARYERKVCQADPKNFAAAFSSLGPDDQQLLRTRVFDPAKCEPVVNSPR